MTNHIKKMLRIVEENLEFSEVTQELIKKKQTLVIYATLSQASKACHQCGLSPFDSYGNQIIVKNVTKTSTVTLEKYNHLPTVIKLKKQKYLCKNCHHYSTAKTYFVNENCFISKHVTFKIIDLLGKKMSLKLIAELCHVSSTTVIRVLKNLEKYIPTNQPEACLPNVLMVDEFRSHAKNEDKMSFICGNGKTGKLVYVLPSRKLDYLNKHFKRYYPNELEKVQFIATDMNAAYFKLADSCFKNAEIIVDRFHVVSHMNKAFNEFRVRENKELVKSKEKKKAHKLKTNWKLLLKNRQAINWYSYHSWRSFPRPKFSHLSEGMVIDRLLAFSDALKHTYNYFHDLQDSFRQKECDEFFRLIRQTPDGVDEEFKEKIQNLLAYETGIKNTLTYPYSNGKLEAKNTHIKTLKRISYGFKSFSNMRISIFIMNQLIEIK